MLFRLIDTYSESSDVITFIWESPEPITWRAGQFIKYTLPHEDADERGVSRWFTNAAPPHEKNPRITTRFTDTHSSSFKSHLRELNIGDTIEAGRPMGSFIVEDTSRPLVMIAGGIGITPFRAILLQLDHDKVEIRGSLLYANRTNDYTFREELEAVAAKHRNLTITYFTDPTHIGIADIKQAAQNYENPYFYLSGPEPMVAKYENLLTKPGSHNENIRTDYFPGYN